MIPKSKKIRKKDSLRLLLWGIISIISISLIVGFLISSNWKVNQRRTELQAKADALKKEIEILEKRNQELRSGISNIQKEDYLEEAAREQFNLKKPGEEVVSVLSPEGKEKKVETQKEKNFWQKILEKIGF